MRKEGDGFRSETNQDKSLQPSLPSFHPILIVRQLVAGLLSVQSAHSVSTRGRINSPRRKMNLQQKNHRLMKRATCILYTNPLAGTTLPVFTDTTLTWNPTCSVFTSALVDIYISISTADGSKPVHLFKGLDYKSGQYTTQFNPGWWNATTGAGSVQAQVRLRGLFFFCIFLLPTRPYPWHSRRSTCITNA